MIKSWQLNRRRLLMVLNNRHLIVMVGHYGRLAVENQRTPSVSVLHHELVRTAERFHLSLCGHQFLLRRNLHRGEVVHLVGFPAPPLLHRWRTLVLAGRFLVHSLDEQVGHGVDRRRRPQGRKVMHQQWVGGNGERHVERPQKRIVAQLLGDGHLHGQRTQRVGSYRVNVGQHVARRAQALVDLDLVDLMLQRVRAQWRKGHVLLRKPRLRPDWLERIVRG